MNIGKRLELFIQTCYKSQLFFSKFIDLDPSYLNRIINSKIIPGADILSKFNNAGISLDWLINGYGSMYSTNKIGEELKNKVLKENYITKSETNNRVISWICENYDNLENFCNSFNLDYYKYYVIIYETGMPDSEYLEILNQSGCNNKWIQTGKGSRYSNNPAGMILKMKSKNVSVKN